MLCAQYLVGADFLPPIMFLVFVILLRNEKSRLGERRADNGVWCRDELATIEFFFHSSKARVMF